ncbi:hypothetical protein N657DRAFT_130512 [Parathielavia appendiculata]|uniref:Uncharacterized protein n=1 Tax=Parathielavia appendiculata TaxID=2587402 RepID=A0AAN6Z2B7_9PEZI|nr:hypothetical protein N657DRAFT_130512 [Parathielavia appendiculata]
MERSTAVLQSPRTTNYAENGIPQHCVLHVLGATTYAVWFGGARQGGMSSTANIVTDGRQDGCVAGRRGRRAAGYRTRQPTGYVGHQWKLIAAVHWNRRPNTERRRRWARRTIDRLPYRYVLVQFKPKLFVSAEFGYYTSSSFTLTFSYSFFLLFLFLFLFLIILFFLLPTRAPWPFDTDLPGC